MVPERRHLTGEQPFHSDVDWTPVYIHRLLLWLLQSCVLGPRTSALCAAHSSTDKVVSERTVEQSVARKAGRPLLGISMAVSIFQISQVRWSGRAMCSLQGTKAVCGSHRRSSGVRAANLAGNQKEGTQEGDHRGRNQGTTLLIVSLSLPQMRLLLLLKPVCVSLHCCCCLLKVVIHHR